MARTAADRSSVMPPMTLETKTRCVAPQANTSPASGGGAGTVSTRSERCSGSNISDPQPSSVSVGDLSETYDDGQDSELLVTQEDSASPARMSAIDRST